MSDTKKPQESMTFTWEMMQLMLDENRKAMLEGIAELKRLPAHEQAELDAKLERQKQARVNRAKEAVQEERLKREIQFNCRHIKSAEGIMQQSHAFRGQVNNDNCCRAQCIRCFKVFPPFKVSQENLKSGMSLGDLKHVTAEFLWQAHMKSFPDCQECAKGNCAVRDLREFRNKRMDEMPEVLPDGKIRAEALIA